MIALAMASAFEQFLNDPSGILADDTINHHPQPLDDTDLTDASLAYLADDALPDPDHGCIVGVIDDAIPFAHERLRLANGHSRVASIWVQDARFRPGAAGGDLPSGTELRGAEIDTWLVRMRAGEVPGEDAIYRGTGALDMTRDTTHSTAFAAGHGAAVAMLAAGFAPDDPAARNHPLIAVSLPPKITEDSMGTLAPISILCSILFIISRARRLCRLIEARTPGRRDPVRLPVVINLSFGLTAGARDGSSLLEQFMDAVSSFQAADLGPVRFVLPVGNHRLARLHGRLRPGEDLGWRLPPDDRTLTAVEIWGPVRNALPQHKMQITLTPPGQQATTTAFTSVWQYTVLKDSKGQDIARAYYTPRLLDDGRWREGVVVMVMPTCPERLAEPYAPPGEWRIGVAPASGEGEYDIGVQRDEVIRGFHREARQSWLHDPAYRIHDDAGRLVELDDASGAKVVRTGAFNAYAGGRHSLRAGAIVENPGRLAPYCSLLHDGQGGDCLATVDRSLGHPGKITRGRDSGSFGLMSGTSMAAPQLTRWLAGELARGTPLPDRAAVRNHLTAAPSSATIGTTPKLPDLPKPPPF